MERERLASWSGGEHERDSKMALENAKLCRIIRKTSRQPTQVQVQRETNLLDLYWGILTSWLI